MTKSQRSVVERGTVWLTRLKGQGVFVGGNCIVTAAHCVSFELSGAMALGDRFHERIKTQKGFVQGSVVAVEPVADIALMRSPDSQDFAEDAEAYETFCGDTEPVPLSAEVAKVSERLPVEIFTHRRTWVSGFAEIFRPDGPTVFVTANEKIEGGTSGGPIVTEHGNC